MTHERSWLTRSTYFQTSRMYALPTFCRSQLAENGRLLVLVTDTGVALPKRKRDQIFSAYFTTKSQGTGLGLAIANARCSHLGHSKQRARGNVLLYAPQSQRMDKLSRSGRILLCT